MISTETIHNKIQMLPSSSQKEVLEFIDDLLEKSAKSNQQEKALAWKDWAKSHSNNTVIIDDSREIFTRTNKRWKIFKPIQTFFKTICATISKR